MKRIQPTLTKARLNYLRKIRDEGPQIRNANFGPVGFQCNALGWTQIINNKDVITAKGCVILDGTNASD